MGEYVVICPKCGSTDIILDPLDKASNIWGLGSTKICANCGFEAKIFPEIKKEEVADFRAHLKSSRQAVKNDYPKIDFSGRNLMILWWKIQGALLLLVSLPLFSVSLFMGLLLMAIGISFIYFSFKLKKKH